jgi:putative hydrolase of the HAD superfamily
VTVSQLLSEVRAVFFDAVGTLLFPKSSAPVVYAEAARQHGLSLDPDEVRNRFIAAYRREEQTDANASWKTSEEREEARWRSIVTDTLLGVSDPESCFRHLFDHFALSSSWKVAPDVEELLRKLSDRGVILGLGSNYDARLRSVLEGVPELALLRDRVVISAAVGVRKPGSEFFREVIQLAGCRPSEVLFVGDDQTNDYQGAKAAGLRAILLDPHNKHADLPHRITRLGELLV